MTIGDSGVWIATDEYELTIGYGLSHTHYDPRYDSLNRALDELINLLIRKRRKTVFLKGDFPYKEKTEIELDDCSFKEMGTALTLVFPFWKKTSRHVTIENALIEYSEIEAEIEDLRDMTTRVTQRTAYK